jgi:hypothetical protein
MADNIHPSHSNSSYREYKGSVGKDPSKQFDAGNTGGSSATHETKGGDAHLSFIQKMFPNISEADAKKFINNLFNGINQEIKKDQARSKERLQRLREDDEG